MARWADEEAFLGKAWRQGGQRFVDALLGCGLQTSQAGRVWGVEAKHHEHGPIDEVGQQNYELRGFL